MNNCKIGFGGNSSSVSVSQIVNPPFIIPPNPILQLFTNSTSFTIDASGISNISSQNYIQLSTIPYSKKKKRNIEEIYSSSSSSNPSCQVSSVTLTSLTCSNLTGLVAGELFAQIFVFGGHSSIIHFANISNPPLPPPPPSSHSSKHQSALSSFHVSPSNLQSLHKKSSSNHQVIQNNNKNNSNGTTIGIAVGVSLAAIFLVLLIIFVIIILVIILVLRKRKRQQNLDSGIEMSESKTHSILQEGINSSVSKYIIELSELLFSDKLAQGAFGVVYRGYWRKQPVAIKELKMNESDSEENQEAFDKSVQELKNEIQTLSLLRHRNIVNFMGICIKPPDTYVIVTEFIEGGSLYERLHVAKKKANFSWNQKLSILHQISCACLFLHQQGVVHRDLKSHNILLEGYPGEKIVPKVCDFGLAKSKEAMEKANNQNTQAVGTPLWMAPEVVIGDSYGSECDVYSFAVIMYEVLFERLPYSDLGNIGNVQFKVAKDPNFRPTIFDFSALGGGGGKVVGEGIAQAKELENKREFVELMKKGWQQDAKARPKFEEIVDSFEDLMKKINSKPEKNNISDPTISLSTNLSSTSSSSTTVSTLTSTSSKN